MMQVSESRCDLDSRGVEPRRSARAFAAPCGWSSDADAALSVAYLCARAVRGEAPELPPLSDGDVGALLSFAARHSIDGCVAMALREAGAETAASREARGHAVFRAGAMASDEARVLAALERAGVAHCPVKGSVLEGCYPGLGMRQMSDRDILIEPSCADGVRRAMEELGFETVAYGTGDADVYHKPPVSNFEMHRRLFSRNERGNAAVVSHYEGVWGRLSKDEGNGFGWHMDATEHYLYMVCHEHKHFSGCGTGLRSLLDVYVWLMRFGAEVDWNYVVRTSHALGLGSFEEENRLLALDLFGGRELSDAQVRVLSFVASSGTYGSAAGRVANGFARHGDGFLGRAAYLWGRVFPPGDSMAPPGSFWEAHRWLLPVRYVCRIVRGFATKPGAMVGELSLAVGRRGLNDIRPVRTRGDG